MVVQKIGTAGASYYYVYSPDCAMSLASAKCQGEAMTAFCGKNKFVVGSTGSSVFDFSGDGEAEVVYRDECWLRVFSGRSGKSCLQHRLHREPCSICR